MSSARNRRNGRGNMFNDPIDHLPNNVSPIESDKALYKGIDQLGDYLPQVEKAIVAKQGGVIEVGKFRFSATGLEIADGISEDEWLSLFQFITRIQASIQWIIGDWISYGELKLNKSYEEISRLIDYKYKPNSLKQLAYVARNVPTSIRIDALKFGHHQVVAALPVPNQKEWLEYAAQQQLSVSQMRSMLNDSPAPSDDDPFGGKNFAKNARKAGQILNRVGGKQKISQKDKLNLENQIRQMRAWLDEAERTIKRK